MIWCHFKLEKSIKLFFRDNQAIQNRVHLQTLNDLGGKASALRAQGKYSEDLSSQGMHHKVNLSWPTSLHISTKVTTHPNNYGNGWYGVSSSLNAASSRFFTTIKRSKIMFICRPSAILVVKLPHCVLRANIQQILHHRECIKKSTCLGLPFSTKATTHRTKYGNGWYGLSSSLNAASSCFSATIKRSKIVFICRPSTILVVKLPHCVLRANIQKTCHHRECITMSTCLGLPVSTFPQR